MAIRERETEKLSDVVRQAAVPLTGAAGDYDALLDLIGDARVVLIGEASHGTHEFYHERALTKDWTSNRRMGRRHGYDSGCPSCWRRWME